MSSVWDRLHNASTDSSHQKQFVNRRPTKTPFASSLRNQKENIASIENGGGSNMATASTVRSHVDSSRMNKILSTQRTSTLFLSKSHAPESFAKLQVRSLKKELVAYEQGNVSSNTLAGHILEAVFQRDIVAAQGINDGATYQMTTSVQQIAHKVYRVTTKRANSNDNNSDQDMIAQARIRFAPAEILIEGYDSSRCATIMAK